MAGKILVGKDEFTPDGYVEVIGSLINVGYEIVGFQDADPVCRHLILRHDVDFDLVTALKLARLEASCGWRSHYFVLLRSEFYNPFSEVSQNALIEILELGHEIGLHFDAGKYKPNDNLSIALAVERKLLETIIGTRISYFSHHRPATIKPQILYEFDDLIDVYSPRFFRDMGYCSDSRGEWHYGHPMEQWAVDKGLALQLLTHPIWWVGEGNTGPQSKLDSFLYERSIKLKFELSTHCSAYQLTDLKE